MVDSSGIGIGDTDQYNYNTVNINNTQPQPQQTVNITPSWIPSVDPKTADFRAAKADFGLQPYMPNMDKDSWYSGILSGDEENYRKAASAAINDKNAQTRLDLLKAVSNDPAAADYVNSKYDLAKLTGTALNSDPRSVIEEYYSGSYFKPLTNPNSEFIRNSMMGQAWSEIPDVVRQGIQVSTNEASKGQYIQSQLENLAPQVSNAQALLLGLAPFGQSAAMRRPAGMFLGKTAAFHGLMGDNLEEQSESLWQQQFDGPGGFKDRIDKVIKDLGPTLGYQWLSYMQGQSTSDRYLNNAFDVIDLAGIGTAASHLATGVIKSLSRALGSVPEAGVERPIPVVQNAAHGNLEEAAIAQVKANLTAVAAAKNPLQQEIQQQVQSLTSNFRIDKDERNLGLGTYGQDLANRMNAADDNFIANTADRIQHVMKVNRVPYLTAQDDIVRAERERIRGEFRGAPNSILNIWGPYPNELTNVLEHKLEIGTYEGTPHGNETQARLMAESLGLHIKTEPFGHTPVGTMEATPISFDKFTDFRKAAREAGLKQKDLTAAGVGNSIDFERAKDSQKPDTGAEIKPFGSGYVIEVRKTFKENSDAVIGDANTGLGIHPDTQTPITWWNSAFKGMHLDPTETLSKAENANRRVSAHAASVLKKLEIPEWKTISSVPREYWGRFNSLLKYGRDLYDPATGEKGYWFKSPQEIEDWYQMFYHGKNYDTSFAEYGRPSSMELEAYFALKRLSTFDLALRNISEYKFQARVGAEQHRFTVRGKDGKKQSVWVHATNHNQVPAGNETVLILHKNGEHRLTNAQNLSSSVRIPEAINKGEMQVSELYNRDYKELDGFVPQAKHFIRYVISEAGMRETKPLDIGQMVPRRGGGHNEYDFEGATVQPRTEFDPITNTTKYLGDRIITVHNSPGEGIDFGKRMDVVRQYRDAGMYDEARIVARDTLNMSPEVYEDYFHPHQTPDGKMLPPMLSNEHPITYVRKGESSIDTSSYLKDKYGEDLQDATTAGSLASQFKVQYTGKRDAEHLFTAENKGTWNKPLWQYSPAKMLDPIPVAGRALNRIINSQFGDDLKIASMTHWLKQALAAKLLDYGPNTENYVWHAPWRVFNGDIKWNDTVDNAKAIAFFKGNRAKIQAFSGVSNPTVSFLHSMADDIAKTLYNKFGPKAAIAPVWLLPKLHDPWRIARSIVVHPILGMFKLSAAVMQGTTFVNTLAMAGPGHALPGVFGAMLHEFTRLNDTPEFMDFLDNIAFGMGWKKGEWKEVSNKLKYSGFFNVGSEVGIVDDPSRVDLVRGIGRVKDKVLNAGMTPFREGAQFVRGASWFTAHHEFRYGSNNKYAWKGDPTGPRTREEELQVLNRAGTLDHNMSRAGNAMYQSGIGSIPAMFWSYRLRLTNLMLGKQLTGAEKLRLFAFSSIAFGLPAGGLGLLGVPLGEWIKSGAYQGYFGLQPYAVGQNEAMSTAMEGGLAEAVAHLTGNWYNFSQYGNQSLLDDVARDKTIHQMIAGAPGEWFGNAYAKISPLAGDFVDWAWNHDKGTTLNDVVEAAKLINSVNVAWSAVTAINTRNWYTRAGNIEMTDVSPLNALLMAATGLRETKALDAFERGRILKDQQDAQNYAKSQAIQQLHFAIASRRDNDPAAFAAHRRNANSLLRAAGYPEEKIYQVWDEAEDTYQQDVPKLINKNFEKSLRESGQSDQADKLQKALEK